MRPSNRLIMLRTAGLILPLLIISTLSHMAHGQTTSDSAGQTASTVDSQNASGGLEEIVVTARKRTEALNSVPLAISAFSSDQIAARGISSVNGISQFTPSFHFQNETGGGSGRNDRSTNTLTFRGLVLSNDTGVRAGGLLFVDGSPVIGNTVPPTQDVERVEVLKGPQSAFFGRSTFSGAVNVITKDPPNVFTAQVSASYASYDSHTESISLGGPVVEDKLRVRVNASDDFQGGQWTNQAAPHQQLGDRGTDEGDVQVLFTPIDSLRIKSAVNYFIFDDGPPAQAAIKQPEMNCNLGGTKGAFYCGTIPTADHLIYGAISGNWDLTPAAYAATIGNSGRFATIINPNFLNHPGLRREVLESNLRADYTLPNDYVISSVTAYNTDQDIALLDNDFRDPSFTAPGGTVNQRYFLDLQLKDISFNQELRISSPDDERFRWLAGVNYLYASETSGTVYGIQNGIVSCACLLTHYNPTTPAAFGAAYFDITPELTLSAEIRYQIDQIKQTTLGNSSGYLIAVPQVYKHNFDSVSPRITLDYKFSDHSIAYILFSRGFRPGGFNTALAVIPPANLTQGASLAYNQEKLDNYEIGVKSGLFDGHVQLNGDFYYDRYRGGQISQSFNFLTASGTQSFLSVVRNVGSFDLYGVEAEANWQVDHDLLLSSSFGYNGSRGNSGYCGDCTAINGGTSLAGKQFVTAPKFTFTASGEYSDHLLNTDYDWFTRADYIYRGKEFVDQANVATIGAKNTLNLRAGVRNETYTAEIFCTNCANDLTMEAAELATGEELYSHGNQSEIRLSLPQKRMIGIKGTARF